MLQENFQIQNRIFLIDYKVNGKNKTFLTTTSSRKNAEHLTRQLEKPTKILVSRVLSLDYQSF
jgi:hypothetical protein